MSSKSEKKKKKKKIRPKHKKESESKTNVEFIAVKLNPESTKDYAHWIYRMLHENRDPSMKVRLEHFYRVLLDELCQRLDKRDCSPLKGLRKLKGDKFLAAFPKAFPEYLQEYMFQLENVPRDIFAKDMESIGLQQSHFEALERPMHREEVTELMQLIWKDIDEHAANSGKKKMSRGYREKAHRQRHVETYQREWSTPDYMVAGAGLAAAGGLAYMSAPYVMPTVNSWVGGWQDVGHTVGNVSGQIGSGASSAWSTVSSAPKNVYKYLSGIGSSLQEGYGTGYLNGSGTQQWLAKQSAAATQATTQAASNAATASWYPTFSGWSFPSWTSWFTPSAATQHAGRYATSQAAEAARFSNYSNSSYIPGLAKGFFMF